MHPISNEKTISRRRARASAGALVAAAVLGLPLMMSAATLPTDAPTEPTTAPATNARRLTLAEAVDLVASNNPAVRAARLGVDVAAAQRATAGLKPGTTFTVGANQFTFPRLFRRPELLGTTDGNAAANTTYTFEVDRTVERGGKRALRVGQAASLAAAAEARVADAIRLQTFELKQSFYAAVLARENLRVVSDSLDSFSRTEQVVAAQVKEGYTSGADLKRVSLQRIRVGGDVAAARKQYEQSVRDVRTLIGDDAGQPPAGVVAADDGATTDAAIVRVSDVAGRSALDQNVELVGDLEILPIPLSLSDLRSAALANRPDLVAARLEVDAANRALSLAASQRTRDVTFGTQYARSGVDNTVGVSVTMPLSTRARADAAVAEATAEKSQAEAELRRAEAVALAEVDKAYADYETGRERLRALVDGAVGDATDVRRASQVSYLEGAKGLLDYLDANRTYNETMTSYNEARYDFRMSLYELECATNTTIVK